MKTSDVKFQIVVLIITFVFAGFKGHSQVSFKQVDSLSYDLYQKKDWKKLADLSQQNEIKYFDYYYLNFRFGVAFYEQKKYQKAVFYFEKALKNNSASDITKEYLFWSYYFLGNNKKAKEYFNGLSKNKQKEIKKQIPNTSELIDFVYLEAGVVSGKTFDLTNENGLYVNLGVSHLLFKKYKIYQAAYYRTWNDSLNKDKYFRYYNNQELRIFNNFSIGLNFNYFKPEEIIKNTLTGQNTAIFKSDNYRVDITFTKIFNTSKIGLLGGVNLSKGLYKDLHSSNTYYYNDRNVNFGALFGMDINKKLGFYTEFETILKKKIFFYNFMLSGIYKVSKKFELNLSYIQKDIENYYYQNGAFLLRYNNKKAGRINLTTNYKYSKKTFLYLTFQQDIIKANSYNTFLFGIKYDL